MWWGGNLEEGARAARWLIRNPCFCETQKKEFHEGHVWLVKFSSHLQEISNDSPEHAPPTTVSQ